MTRAQAFAEYVRLLALEEGGAVMPDASIPVVAETIAGLQEATEGYLERFGIKEAWGGGARALVEEGASSAPEGPTPEEVRQGLFQAFVFRLMLDRHGVDLGDFHHVPAIAESTDRMRRFIEEALYEGLAGTAKTIRGLMNA